MNVALRNEFISDIAAGDMHNIVVTRAGDLYSWGRGRRGSRTWISGSRACLGC